MPRVPGAVTKNSCLTVFRLLSLQFRVFMATVRRFCLNSFDELDSSNSAQLRQNKVFFKLFFYFLDPTMTTQDASQFQANSLTKMRAGLNESSSGNPFVSVPLKL